MANTASAILWPAVEQAPPAVGTDEPGWTFYTQVSVSGPVGLHDGAPRRELRGAGPP